MILAGLRSDFAATISHQGDLEATVEKILALDFIPYAVVTGSELGTELSDQLTERFNLPGNGKKQQ